MPVISAAPNDSLLEKLKSNLQEVKARRGEFYVFADAGSEIPESEGVHTQTTQRLNDSFPGGCSAGTDLERTFEPREADSQCLNSPACAALSPRSGGMMGSASWHIKDRLPVGWGAIRECFVSIFISVPSANEILRLTRVHEQP